MITEGSSVHCERLDSPPPATDRISHGLRPAFRRAGEDRRVYDGRCRAAPVDRGGVSIRDTLLDR
ncbi:hypothetical protein GCM10022215_31010 [Nocardioides fonticola]|uniref:Uncharacterized protein n=1 Tax=Nocardioides fonticola TaxID=450363 RepID=A0ABP7XQJ5_9ACTN